MSTLHWRHHKQETRTRKFIRLSIVSHLLSVSSSSRCSKYSCVLFARANFCWSELFVEFLRIIYIIHRLMLLCEHWTQENNFRDINLTRYFQGKVRAPIAICDCVSLIG